MLTLFVYSQAKNQTDKNIQMAISVTNNHSYETQLSKL